MPRKSVLNDSEQVIIASLRNYDREETYRVAISGRTEWQFDPDEDDAYIYFLNPNTDEVESVGDVDDLHNV